jgi:phosphoribosylanthranilate isomerase
MRQVRVKICGITRAEDLAVATSAGADAVGFVVGVPSSPRNIPVEKAEKLIERVPVFAQSVLVTVPTSVAELLKIHEKVSPDAVQIHGDLLDASAFREKLPDTSLIVAVSANPIEALEVASKASKASDAILLDTFARGRYGGTGIVNDWELSKRVRQAIHPKPLILAGGLDPDNVREAVRVVRPYAVDVSSGVELQSGIKDPSKIIAFIKEAKELSI